MHVINSIGEFVLDLSDVAEDVSFLPKIRMDTVYF